MFPIVLQTQLSRAIFSETKTLRATSLEKKTLRIWKSKKKHKKKNKKKKKKKSSCMFLSLENLRKWR